MDRMPWKSPDQSPEEHPMRRLLTLPMAVGLLFSFAAFLHTWEPGNGTVWPFRIVYGGISALLALGIVRAWTRPRRSGA